MSGAVGLLLAVAAAGAAPAAPVSDEVVVNQINELNVSALHKIEAGRFPAARKFLLDAERRGRERGGVVAGVVLARTYLYLGAVEIMAGGDLEQAKRSFGRALCREPRLRPVGPIAAHADVVRMFSITRSERNAQDCRFVAAIVQRYRRVQERDLPVRIQALDCPNEDEIIAGVDFVVRCALAPNLPVAKVFLRYRPPRSEEYASVEMKRSARGWWTAAVPGKDIQGKSLAYYFEGKNADGKLMVVNGEVSSPNFALVVSPDLCVCD